MSPRMRTVVTVGAVTVLHLLALQALNAGLMQRRVERVLPISLLEATVRSSTAATTIERSAPPAPRLPAQAAATSRSRTPVESARVEPETAAPAVPSALAPATASAHPGSNTALPAAAAATTAQAAAPAARTEAGTSSRASDVIAAPAPAQPPRVELPSSDAAYLQNPRPQYPPMSKRLREEGEVIVNVFIAVDGTAQRAELKRSSGYDRLDRIAVETALRWRYVPGKRGGVPEPMWVEVPLEFRLDAAVR
jgi:periplasmic protein TonB